MEGLCFARCMSEEAPPRPPGWRHLADFLALKRNTTLLMVGLVLAGTGERLWLVFAPKYPKPLVRECSSLASSMPCKL